MSLTPDLTRRQHEALTYIRDGVGIFHRLTGENLERLGLARCTNAFRLVGSNCELASKWALTDLGLAALTKREAA